MGMMSPCMGCIDQGLAGSFISVLRFLARSVFFLLFISLDWCVCVSTTCSLHYFTWADTLDSRSKDYLDTVLVYLSQYVHLFLMLYC